MIGLEGCSGLNDASHDDDIFNIIDDSHGVDTVYCLVIYLFGLNELNIYIDLSRDCLR